MTTEQPFSPTPEQQAVIDAIEGPILVMAPVGAGKTRVLAERVAKAVATGVAPNRILCLTFTNRAAKEMISRTQLVDAPRARGVTVKTFHGLCAQILRAEADHLGIPSDFVIYDEEDRIDLLADIVGQSADRSTLQRIANNIGDVKERASADRLLTKIELNGLYSGLAIEGTATRYHAVLHARHALDFADLVYLTRSALLTHGPVARRWADRYDFLQVDEVQDTQLAEYEIVRHLAIRTRNLAMIGDLDQTIYEWRHAEPALLIQQLEEDFHPARYPLSENHRATRTLIAAADGIAASLASRQTTCRPAAHCPEGEPILVHEAPTDRMEATWVLEEIQALATAHPEVPYRRMAVLTRTNRRAGLIHDVLNGTIPCFTVEQFEFFRRQEVRDALAYLRLIQNPNDGGAMRRVLLRPARGIGASTLDGIQKEGVPAGLRLWDLAVGETLRCGDPYGPLLDALRTRKILVIDTETTGLNPTRDEVIELATLEPTESGARETHTYLRNTVDVGASEGVHGLSSSLLAEQGEDPGPALQRFLAATEGRVVVGHNIGFDLQMIRAHARRLGLTVGRCAWVDTLDLARRFVKATDYRLETLAQVLHLSRKPTHQAADDTRTTWELLQALVPKIEAGASQRRQTVERYGEAFGHLARLFDDWRDASAVMRPPVLLDRVLKESGLREQYNDDPHRLSNVEELRRVFRSRDDFGVAPESSLRTVLEFASLARGVDSFSEEENRLPILTVHQAKGMEFDAVFIAGLVEGEFPNYRSSQDGRAEEERRLFYVAVTRARRRLYLSWHLAEDYRPRQPSPLLPLIPERLRRSV